MCDHFLDTNQETCVSTLDLIKFYSAYLAGIRDRIADEHDAYDLSGGRFGRQSDDQSSAVTNLIADRLGEPDIQNIIKPYGGSIDYTSVKIILDYDMCRRM